MSFRFRLPFAALHVDFLLAIAIALLFAAGCAIKMVHPEDAERTELPLVRAAVLPVAQ
jgi:hypothetical protein